MIPTLSFLVKTSGSMAVFFVPLLGCSSGSDRNACSIRLSPNC